MEGEVVLLGRDILYRDPDPVKYPPTEFIFKAWECNGKFDPKLVGKEILPLCVPSKEEFDLRFPTESNYERFLQKHKLRKPESERGNGLIPHVFMLPYSEEEFEEQNLSGDYKTL